MAKAVGEKREAWKMIKFIKDRGEQPIWPEEEGNQEGGGQSTAEYGGRNVPKA